MPHSSETQPGFGDAAEGARDAPALRRVLADMALEFLRAQPEDPGRAADCARRFVRASFVETVPPRSLFGQV